LRLQKWGREKQKIAKAGKIRQDKGGKKESARWGGKFDVMSQERVVTPVAMPCFFDKSLKSYH